jgi:hypothetical protein
MRKRKFELNETFAFRELTDATGDVSPLYRYS